MVSTPYTYPASDLITDSGHYVPYVSEITVSSSGRTLCVFINTGSPSDCPDNILSLITAIHIACSNTTKR